MPASSPLTMKRKLPSTSDSPRGGCGAAAAPPRPSKGSATAKRHGKAQSAPRRKLTDPPPAKLVEVQTVPRERYEGAVEEVEHLRLALREAEKAARRAETETEEAQQAAGLERERAEKALAYMERVLELLS